MAWISFGALPCRGGDFMTARVSMLLKSRTSLTWFLVGLRTYQHPGIFHSYDILLALTVKCWGGHIYFIDLLKSSTETKCSVFKKTCVSLAAWKGLTGTVCEIRGFPALLGNTPCPVKMVTCVLAFRCQHFGRACCRPIQGSSTSFRLPEEGGCKLLRNVRTLYQSTECHVMSKGNGVFRSGLVS